jgi:hypothetical protein
MSFWGKKKETNAGVIGDMSPEQDQCLVELK